MKLLLDLRDIGFMLRTGGPYVYMYVQLARLRSFHSGVL